MHCPDTGSDENNFDGFLGTRHVPFWKGGTNSAWHLQKSAESVYVVVK
jgi:hypothetical protein